MDAYKSPEPWQMPEPKPIYSSTYLGHDGVYHFEVWADDNRRIHGGKYSLYFRHEGPDRITEHSIHDDEDLIREVMLAIDLDVYAKKVGNFYMRELVEATPRFSQVISDNRV